MVSVLTLLVTYHRKYDAVLLVFPIAWAFSAVLDGRRLLGGIALLLSFTFLLPIQVFFAMLQQNGQVPSWLTRTVVWESVLLPLHVWALVSLAVVFLRLPFATPTCGRDVRNRRTPYSS